MYDRETDTLWSHFTGEAVSGKLSGAKLQMIAAIPKITWKEWKETFPRSRVLTIDGRQHIEHDQYQSYHSSGKTGIEKVTNPDGRLGSKEIVIGVIVGGEQKAYPLKIVRSQGLILDRIAKKDLAIYYDDKTKFSAVYELKVGGEVIKLRDETVNNVISDDRGNKWNLVSAEALEGTLKGKKLKRVPHINVYWFAWADYYPATEVYNR